MYDKKTLEELEQLAATLREQLRLNPENYSELEQERLAEVEQWIALRRQENKAETPAAA